MERASTVSDNGPNVGTKLSDMEIHKLKNNNRRPI